MTVVPPPPLPASSRPADAEKGKVEHAGGGPDPNLVKWEENDPENPHNFSTAYKCWITFQLGLLALSASLGSSIISPAETELKAYLNIGTEVSILPVSLYMYVTYPNHRIQPRYKLPSSSY